jgi:hypothetical protein
LIVLEAKILNEVPFNLNTKEMMDTKWSYPIDTLIDVKKNPNTYTKWFRLYILKYFSDIF